MSLLDFDEAVKISDDPDREEKVKISKRLEDETNLDRRIDITESRFLEEMDELERLKVISTDKKERISIKIAELLLELEKVQLRRRKEAMESHVNWNHITAVSEFFVKRFLNIFDDLGIDAEIESQIVDTFLKAFETWETDLVKEGVLDRNSDG